ncbi:MAG TPA: hypothetical protein ENG27_00365, partial [Candidatus Bathyarchaeota archaeon]|nr:hypothetical protein [Candidatus Bathyarchaeota archaeon]
DDNPETDDPKVIDEVSFVPNESPRDGHGHGTLMAGILSGTGAASSTGFYSGDETKNATIREYTQIGVAPASKLLNVKVISNDGSGDASWIVSGIEWAVEHGADVISMSIGAYPERPGDVIMDAVKAAVEAGVVVVVAAGNDGPGSFSISTPALSPYVITVGAVYETENITFFSSRGPAPFYVLAKPDLVAPGAAVISTSREFNEEKGVYYEEVWGTSAATPHVAGVAALLRQAFPNASAYEIKAALMLGAKDLGVDYCIQGAGLVDALGAYNVLSTRSKPIAFAPPKIDSMSWPTVALYPGDFKVINITVVGGENLTDATWRIEGSIKDIASFTSAEKLCLHKVYTVREKEISDTTPHLFIYGDNYDSGDMLELGNYTGLGTVAIQIVIPEDAEPNHYSGYLRLYSGGKVVASLPIKIDVRRPKAKVIFDDVSQFPEDRETLWGGSFMGWGVELWWRDVAQAGYDVDSLMQVMNKTGLDPWAILLSGNYQVIYLHDTDLRMGISGALPKILDSNLSIVALYDGGFEYSLISSEVYTEWSEIALIGVAENFNKEHPISRGVKCVPALGGLGLAVHEDAEIVATAISYDDPSGSAVFIATYEAEGGGRFIAIGDSNIFDCARTPDFTWYYLWKNYEVEVASID